MVVTPNNPRHNVRADDAPLSAASFYVDNLPGLPSYPGRPMHMYAGHIPSDPSGSSKSQADTHVGPHIFFFMIRARRLADKERLVFWFNGGPGCSSFDGLMLESGPFRTDGKGGLRLIDGGWDEYTTVVFVDQPPGTGLSYTTDDQFVHELEEAADHVVQFMRRFYEIFPEYRTIDTYLAGESYAGQYIPYIADAILNSNLAMPLIGLAMGNAWIDAKSQYPGYLDFGLKYGLIQEGTEAYISSKHLLDNCLNKLNAQTGPEPPDLNACSGIMNSIVRGLDKDVSGQRLCMNVYDIRLSDTFPACGMNWPIELPDIKIYLRRPDVIQALHATHKSEGWVECNHQVSGQLRNKHSVASITLMPKLLTKLQIMLFSGDQDFICNYMGTETLISNLEWNGQQGLGDAETLSWMVDGSDAGTWVTARNLTYVRVFNSSHMVPYDVPQVAHDMMLRFMGLDFAQLASGSANIPSKLGNDSKLGLTKPTSSETMPTPTPSTGKTPEQDKATWEAYYNAGSAALLLAVIAIVIGIFFFFKRRRRLMAIPTGDIEERIPLSQQTDAGLSNVYRDQDNSSRKREVGKEKVGESQTVFELGSDGEDDYADKDARPRRS